jgi:hypothetical protein
MRIRVRGLASPPGPVRNTPAPMAAACDWGPWPARGPRGRRWFDCRPGCAPVEARETSESQLGLDPMEQKEFCFYREFTEFRVNTQQQDLRKGTAGTPPDNQAVLAVTAGDIVLLSDCSPHRAMHQRSKRKRDRCNRDWSEDYIDELRRHNQEVIQTAAAAIVSSAAHFPRIHSGSYLPKDTAWATASHAACRRGAAVAQTGSP